MNENFKNIMQETLLNQLGSWITSKDYGDKNK